LRGFPSPGVLLRMLMLHVARGYSLRDIPRMAERKPRRKGQCQGSSTANAAREARPRHWPGLGYALAIRGVSFGNPASQTQTETVTDLIRVRGLWFYLVR
jgi:hypothetical protein